MKVVFRVDASSQIGTGHLMRCLTLANALKIRGVDVTFVCRHIPENYTIRLEAMGHQLLRLNNRNLTDTHGDLPHSSWLETTQECDAKDTVEKLKHGNWDWLVVDHYALDARWESILRPCVKRILVIDDLADREHDCDMLLDQNPYLSMEKRYSGKVPDSCCLLLGARYALLREEYLEARQSVQPRDGDVKRLLVFLGGIDAENLTLRTLQALTEIVKNLLVDVVIGAQHPDISSVQAYCSAHGFQCYVHTDRMAELMARADLAIGAGGTATWERCSVGLPTFAVCLAENQRMLLHDSGRKGLVYAPEINIHSPEEMRLHLRALISNSALRNMISRNGLEAVDALGARRLMRKMNISDVTIRPATRDDGDNLLLWRNHPDVRGMSNNSGEIDRESHFRWLNAVIADPQRHLLIGTRNGQSVGVVRFDFRGEAARISIYLVPGKPSRGTGAELLVAVEQWLQIHYPQILIIEAEVLRDNEPSHRLFISSGYIVHNTLYIKELSK